VTGGQVITDELGISVEQAEHLLEEARRHLGTGYLSGNYKDIYAFILLIVVLMVRPSGLLGITVKTKA
jgi:branched-subunit amino acid ABC-type transport system permease component